MKKIILFLYLSICSIPLTAYAKDKKSESSFTISPYTSITLGKLDEYLYSSTLQDKLVSHLEWNMNPLFNIGIEANYYKRNFSINLDTSIAFPTQTGKMHDSDFNPFTGTKNIYSISQENGKLNLNTSIELSYSFTFCTYFSVSPIFKTDYIYNSFEARDGYGWYGTETYSLNHEEVAWNDPNARYFKTGTLNGINFQKHSFYTFTGLSIECHIKKIDLGIKMFVSPFCYFYTMDEHLSKRKTYKIEEIQDSNWNQFCITTTASLNLTKNITPFFSMTKIWGKENIGELGTNYFSNNLASSEQKSGSQASYLTFKIGSKIIIN